MRSGQGLSSNNQAGATDKDTHKARSILSLTVLGAPRLGVAAGPGPKKELSMSVMAGHSFLGR